jgi:hypothetical protein
MCVWVVSTSVENRVFHTTLHDAHHSHAIWVWGNHSTQEDREVVLQQRRKKNLFHFNTHFKFEFCKEKRKPIIVLCVPFPINSAPKIRNFKPGNKRPRCKWNVKKSSRTAFTEYHPSVSSIIAWSPPKRGYSFGLASSSFSLHSLCTLKENRSTQYNMNMKRIIIIIMSVHQTRKQRKKVPLICSEKKELRFPG